MTIALSVISVVLALAWLPLGARFLRGWRNRKNPVSLAICGAIALFAYTNLMFVMAYNNQTSWGFFAVATHVFDCIIIVNFYVAFKWSEIRFPEQRKKPPEYTVPPMNVPKT